jgi:nucleoside-diphosphate-sugar epimerase
MTSGLSMSRSTRLMSYVPDLSRQGTYSIEKARRRLGYEARVGLDEGFERTARWLREQGLLGPLRGG